MLQIVAQIAVGVFVFGVAFLTQDQILLPFIGAVSLAAGVVLAAERWKLL